MVAPPSGLSVITNNNGIKLSQKIALLYCSVIDMIDIDLYSRKFKNSTVVSIPCSAFKI